MVVPRNWTSVHVWLHFCWRVVGTFRNQRLESEWNENDTKCFLYADKSANTMFLQFTRILSDFESKLFNFSRWSRLKHLENSAHSSSCSALDLSFLLIRSRRFAKSVWSTAPRKLSITTKGDFCFNLFEINSHFPDDPCDTVAGAKAVNPRGKSHDDTDGTVWRRLELSSESEAERRRLCCSVFSVVQHAACGQTAQPGWISFGRRGWWELPCLKRRRALCTLDRRWQLEKLTSFCS